MAMFNRKTKKKSEKSASVSGAAQPLLGIVQKARITEKTADANKDRKYGFLVAEHANKPQIRTAISAQYGVTVTSVHVINMPKKMRRRGRQVGYKAGFKKAMVTLAEGQSIEIQ